MFVLWRYVWCGDGDVRGVWRTAQVVLTANENEDYLIKILLRQTRRPEVCARARLSQARLVLVLYAIYLFPAL